jgi:hypothetical protein
VLADSDERVAVRVPELVTGAPETLNMLGKDSPTLVTDVAQVPSALRKFVVLPVEAGVRPGVDPENTGTEIDTPGPTTAPEPPVTCTGELAVRFPSTREFCFPFRAACRSVWFESVPVTFPQATLGTELFQAVPSEVRTLPESPGDTEAI